MEYIDKNIFSLDCSRYFIKHDNKNRRIFCKKSTIMEYKHLLLAEQLLSTYSLLKVNNRSYKVCVPNIYAYHDSIIEMEFFNGYNLELLLRNENTHLQGVKFLNNLLIFLLEKGFNWIDFAPRNILIGNNQICLIDFEKELSSLIIDKSIYLQNHVYEEYSSFIFENERLLSIDDVFSIKTFNNYDVNINSIKIIRCKYLCELLYNKSHINILDYYDVWKLILKAEIPFIFNENMIFPRLYLGGILKDKEISNKPYFKYANKIIEINECNSPEEKFKILNRY